MPTTKASERDLLTVAWGSQQKPLDVTVIRGSFKTHETAGEQDSYYMRILDY